MCIRDWADGVKPEHVVQSVVQAGGDEQTVQGSVDAGADAVHASDAVANCDQSVEDQRPDEQMCIRDSLNSGWLYCTTTCAGVQSARR